MPMPHPDPVRREQDNATITRNRTLAQRAFDALFADWSLHAIGGGCVVVPKGTPVIAGNSLSAVVGQISGAAVHGCKPGTGWPVRSTS